LRTILFFLLLIFFKALESQSQVPFKGGFSFGAVASQVDGDGYSGYNKSAITAGLWVSKAIDKQSTIQLEMNFVPKGSRSSTKINLDNINHYKLTLRYIEIPLLYKYESRRIVFVLGLAANYLFYDYQEGYFSQVAQYQNTTGFNRFDISGIVGVSMVLNELWQVGSRFTYSLRDAADNYIAPGEIVYNKQYNNCLMFALYRTFGHVNHK